ncbi:unnamed protein product [Spirodela intermedia]|uniref:Uncharacterized protein n=2 Tax=Spirodela intermedia TaxID=51605 RepID=A0A7I8IPB7_SPIIN|nr:unnamed protein product [Spirodela intermedia]CAA6659620.1 unnamed protein product [Spirodela intermedia]CAA7395955.1 unnamed protein product [Spirodela intermedia]
MKVVHMLGSFILRFVQQEE